MAKPASALQDFDDAEETAPVVAPQVGGAIGQHVATVIGGFKDFCLKKELSRAIDDNGFEQPSEVQQQALPQAMMGKDILGQAKSGMGKTAVFVFALLEQIEKQPAGTEPYVQAIVLVHARELAYQIDHEFRRFNKYLPHATTAVFYGGVLESENIKVLKNKETRPAIVVGTPGRVASLINQKALDASHVKWFVVDEFDRCLEDAPMRRDVQAIFLATPRTKQVMMFSATMTEELRATAKKFMQNPQEIYVDQQSKLTLHGLAQYYCSLTEVEKIKRLSELLDFIEFNQCIIFTRSRDRAEALALQLRKMQFPAQAMHSKMDQAERLKVYESCKSNNTRIVVATDLFGRGIDIDRINFVIQYDMAGDADSYLHRVGRAGRFGTKGLTVAFITPEPIEVAMKGQKEKTKYLEADIMKQVQERFEMKVVELTNIREQLSTAQYMKQ